MSLPSSLYRTLRSPALAVALLLAVAVLAAVGTLAPAPLEDSGAGGPGSPLARILGLQHTFRSPPFLALVTLLVLNVAACTWHRLGPRWRQRAGGARAITDLLLHASLLLVLAGGLLKGLFAFTGTENIYVGESAATVFDWRAKRDAALDFGIRVDEFEERFYPVRARVGLRRSGTGERLGLLEVVEGVSATTPGGEARLGVLGYDSAAGLIRFLVDAGGAASEVSLATKAGAAATASVRGFELTLIAYRADLKGSRARITLIERGAAVASGWLSPNGSLRYRGLDLFLTAWGADPQGKRFCGIQVVRDPGAPLFWVGCVLLALAIPAHFFVKGRHAA